jgi:hypothetical protein
VKPFSTWPARIVYWRMSNTTPYTFINFSGDNVDFYINPSQVSVPWVVPSMLNKWSHIVCVRRWTTSEIYINGELKASGTWSTSWTNAGNFSELWQNENYNFFDWLIDEFEMYDNALTPAEIKNKYLFYNWFI